MTNPLPLGAPAVFPSNEVLHGQDAHATFSQPMSRLPDIPGGWAERRLDVGSKSFVVTLPADPDAFLDDPAVQEANWLSDFMPYWSYLWPSSSRMACLVCESPLFAQDEGQTAERTLEIGAGVGLVGLAALVAGYDVTFSDYDNTSVCLAVHNAAQNGFAGRDGILLDWREIEAARLQPFSVIFGCDVVYEAGNHPLVLNVLDKLLESDGVCWIGDPGRGALARFVLLAEERGFHVTVFDENGEKIPSAVDRQRGTSPLDLRFVVNDFRLLRLRRSSM
jgi:predicted nicotinamide N-methyase